MEGDALSGENEEADPTVVPLIVVDDRGRRIGGAPANGDVIDLAPSGPSADELADLAVAVALAMGGQVAKAAKVSMRLTGTVLQRLSQGAIGQNLVRSLRTLLDDPTEESPRDLAAVTQRLEDQMARLFGVVVPVVVESIDINGVIERVDFDRLLANVDIGAIVDRLDIDGVMRRVDVDALVGRLDIDALLDRVDIDALMERIDIGALLDRVDIDALMERIDIDALMERTHIEEIVARSTSQVADSAVDLGRRQAVGLDALVMRIVDRLLGREGAEAPIGPSALVFEPEANGVPIEPAGGEPPSDGAA